MKKFLSILTIAALLLSMAACGNTGSTQNQEAENTPAYDTPAEDTDSTDSNTNNDNTEDNNTNDMNTVGTVDPIPAYEAFHTKSIWFGISDNQSFAKDSFIQVIFAFDGKGNVTVYNNVEQFRFSMINNSMSDDEVLAIVKDLEMESRALKDVFSEPQPQPVSLQVYTDDSGNITEEEVIKYTDDESGLNGVVINRELIVDPFVQPIYDMQFSGYTTFKTRIPDSDTIHPGFNLDTADTSGITVD